MQREPSRSIEIAAQISVSQHELDCDVITPKNRTPPISKVNPRKIFPSMDALAYTAFPAIIHRGNYAIRPKTSPDVYMDWDLKTPRLNDIHEYLWLAGLPSAARPLHRQKVLGRSITITEDTDEHLVWFENQIFIKPLPDYLLDYNYWNEHLCSSTDLYESACGLLLSYAWLVCHKRDLNMAKEFDLLSQDIAWADWVEFLDIFLDNIDVATLKDVNKRYRYGELRLSRLNAIYRCTPSKYSLRRLIRGYKAGSTWYNAFFARHFKWMLVVFALLSVFLSALQVGLATSALQNKHSFQTISYCFTIASLALIVASVSTVLSVWAFLFWYHLISTWQNKRAVDRCRRTGVSIP